MTDEEKKSPRDITRDDFIEVIAERTCELFDRQDELVKAIKLIEATGDPNSPTTEMVIQALATSGVETQGRLFESREIAGVFGLEKEVAAIMIEKIADTARARGVDPNDPGFGYGEELKKRIIDGEFS